MPKTLRTLNRYCVYTTNPISLKIPAGVTSIDVWAISRNSNISNIIVENGNSVYDSRNNCNAIIRTTTNTLICGFKNTIIPNTVTSIESNAFQNCSGLTSITIPESVTSIGQSAFENCYDLTSVTIPESVTSIGQYAFASCGSLTTVNYRGTQEQWNALLENVGSNNDYLKNATLVPNYKGE